MKDFTATDRPVFVGFIDFERIGRNGGGRVPVAVHGYWSSETISIYVDRKFGWSGEDKGRAAWEFTVSHSSGGRDTAEVADDLEAELNFAQGIQEAVSVARHLKGRADELEAKFQAERAEREAAEKAEREAKEAALAADPEVGPASAKTLLRMMLDAAALSETGAVTTDLYARAVEKSSAKLQVQNRYGAPVFRINDVKVGRARALDALASASARTVNAWLANRSAMPTT